MIAARNFTGLTPRERRRLVKAIRCCRRDRLSAGATVTFCLLLLRAGGYGPRHTIRITERETALLLDGWQAAFGPLTWPNVLRFETALRCGFVPARP
jgi:hypothetical protein